MSTVVAVQVPLGMRPGGQFMVRSPAGQSMVAQVPFGVAPGQMMYVRMPAPPPIPIVMVQEQAPPPPENEETKVVETKIYNPTTLAEAPNPEDLMPCFACCCTICSIYPKVPNCIGIFAKGVLGCCDIEAVFCKPGSAKNSLCICTKGECELIIPEVCCKLTYQMCCADTRCAFPCDDEVPCMLTACGIQCVKEYKCACGVAETVQTKEDERTSERV